MPGSHLKYKFLESLQDGKDDTSVWICQYYLDNIYKGKKTRMKTKVRTGCSVSGAVIKTAQIFVHMWLEEYYCTLLICSSPMKYKKFLVLLWHLCFSACVKCSWKKLANFSLELLNFLWVASYTKHFCIPTLFWRLKLQQRRSFKPRCKQLHGHLCCIEESIEFSFKMNK